MKQILRFNKIIKSIIIAGDLCILNALFVTLYYVLRTARITMWSARTMRRWSTTPLE